MKALGILLYIHKDCIMVSEQTMLFSPIELKIFSGLSDLLNNEMTNNLYVCDCVILWRICVCNASCVIISISKYLPISITFGTNILQCNTSGWFFVFSSFKFLWFSMNFYTWVRALLWYPNKPCYFLSLSWNFFSGIFSPPEQWNDQ